MKPQDNSAFANKSVPEPKVPVHVPENVPHGTSATEKVTKETTIKRHFSEHFSDPEVIKEVVTETVTTKLTFEQRFENARILAQAAVNDLTTVGRQNASEYAQRRAKELQEQVNAL